MEFAKLFLRNLLEEISAPESAPVRETVRETAPETVKETAPVKETETNILYFYADWCSYCNNIKSQMEQIKTDFNNKVINNNKVNITFINCSKKNKEMENLMTKFNITWFPTLLIDKNKPLKFSNTFSYNTVSTFINKEAIVA
jgi:thiol-disulfide isomerase/thioredoxin